MTQNIAKIKATMQFLHLTGFIFLTYRSIASMLCKIDGNLALRMSTTFDFKKIQEFYNFANQQFLQ